jgi:hypothetical protein
MGATRKMKEQPGAVRHARHSRWASRRARARLGVGATALAIAFTLVPAVPAISALPVGVSAGPPTSGTVETGCCA